MKHTIIASLTAALALSIAANANVFTDVKDALGDTMTLGKLASYCVDYYDLYHIEPAENSFTDLPDEHPNKNAILRLVSAGYVLGYGDGIIAPDEVMTSNRVYTILTRIESALISNPNFDSANFAPNVTAKMCLPEYWLAMYPDAGKVIMTPEEIEAYNRSVIGTAATKTYDLLAEPETFGGITLRDKLKGVKAPADVYFTDGTPLPTNSTYIKSIRENISKLEVVTEMPVSYGIVVNGTVMKTFPHDEYLTNDPDNPDWDAGVCDSLYVGEPLILMLKTVDGKYWYAKSNRYEGWVSVEDIAVCRDRKQWEGVINPSDFLVVTGDKIVLESTTDKDVNGKLLMMGTKLALTNYPYVLNQRMPWNNYVAVLPCRNENGEYCTKNVFIPINRDVNIGYLPYTAENVVRQAFKTLGNRYGNCGLLNAEDGAGLTRAIYSCFGFALPHDVALQAKLPTGVTKLNGKSLKDKQAFLDALTPGSIVQISNHEMLYLGKVDGKYYVINAANVLYAPGNDAEAVPVNTVIINDLSFGYKSGTKVSPLINLLTYTIELKK